MSKRVIVDHLDGFRALEERNLVLTAAKLSSDSAAGSVSTFVDVLMMRNEFKTSACKLEKDIYNQTIIGERLWMIVYSNTCFSLTPAQIDEIAVLIQPTKDRAAHFIDVRRWHGIVITVQQGFHEDAELLHKREKIFRVCFN